VTYLKELSQNLSGRTEENHDKPRAAINVTEIPIGCLLNTNLQQVASWDDVVVMGNE